MEKINRELLNKYFEGGCSGAERKEVIKWFTEDKYKPALKYVWAKHFHEVLEQDNIIDNQEIQPILDKIHHCLNIRSYRQSVGFSLKRLVQSVGKIAAVLFLPLLLLAGWYYMKYPPVVQNRMSMAELVVPKGARIHFVLPDSSQGWLNSESTLRYPLAFHGKNRTVFLTGEGYFEVKKHKQKPFIVKTGNMEVEALGTKFDVNAYREDEEMEVTLISGKVRISGEMQRGDTRPLTVLEPGQQAQIRKVDFRFHKTNVQDAEGYVAWKDGKLIFRNDPMDQVVKKLGRWYNVKFLLQERSLKDYRYHATFQYESLDEVLKLIKLTSPVDYRIVKRKKLPDGSFSKKRIILFAKKGINLNSKYVR